jgi:hypothetical protein
VRSTWAGGGLRSSGPDGLGRGGLAGGGREEGEKGAALQAKRRGNVDTRSSAAARANVTGACVREKCFWGAKHTCMQAHARTARGGGAYAAGASAQERRRAMATRGQGRCKHIKAQGRCGGQGTTMREQTVRVGAAGRAQAWWRGAQRSGCFGPRHADWGRARACLKSRGCEDARGAGVTCRPVLSCPVLSASVLSVGAREIRPGAGARPSCARL